jgi:calcineurin-like phosphoesterase family protein
MLTFLQLSDIHFRGANRERAEKEEKALDYGFRKLLIEDARKASESAGGISGVLVCGDIADKGRTSEFIQATEWLQNLCAAIDLDPWLIWVVPGNHDIDQGRIGPLQQELRMKIREAAHPDLDRILQAALSHQAQREALYTPLENYLEFASAYNCMFSEELCWKDHLDLSEAQLHLRGINSSLVCGPDDDDDINRMVIGSDQARVEKHPNVVHYTLCHHPHEWLLDSEEVDSLFRENVHIRVTGHLHVRELVTTALGVYLKAGAVSPSRTEENQFVEPCVPRYDLISLRTVSIDGKPHLDIWVEGRVWRGSDGWVADNDPGGSIARRYELGGSAVGQELNDKREGPADEIQRPKLELRFRLARLQPYDREQCALAIGTPLDDVAEAAPHQQVALLYGWAEKEDLLASLWEAVMKAGRIPTSATNPFR